MSSSKLKYNSNIITILLQTENYLSENEKESPPMPGIGFGIQGEKPSRLIVIPGGVADRMGLKNDDELLAIDGKTLHGLDHLNIVTKLAHKCVNRKEMLVTIKRRQTTKKTIPEGNLRQQNFGNKNKEEKTEKEEEKGQQKKKNNFSFQKFPMPLEGREGGIYQSRWSNRLNFQTKFHLNTPPQHFNKYKHRRSLPPLNSSTKEFSFENSKNLIKQKLQPISLFVTEFIGKFTDFIIKPLNNYDDAILYFEKILKEFNIPTNQKQTFCLLSAFEDHLQIFPFIFDELNINQNINPPINLNKDQIITISRSHTEQKMFGILTTSNKNKENIFECFLFKTLPENLQKHSEHVKMSELLNIKCRKESSSFTNKNLPKLTTTTTFNCLEFTSNCSRIIANIRFLSFENSSSSSSSNSSSPTKEKIKNKIVYKFLKSIGLVNSLEIERELNNDFDDSDENCQNTSTESIANSGDLCDPEEIFEGNCSFEERGFNSPQTQQKTTNEYSPIISNYSQMPQCHRNCHFTPSSHQPIFKSNRWSRPFSINHQSTTFSSVSPAYLLGVIDNSQQENCLDKLDNIKQQKDFEKEEEQTANQLNKDLKSSSSPFVAANSATISTSRLHSTSSTIFSTQFSTEESLKENRRPNNREVLKSPTTALSELSSPRSSSVKIRLLDRTQQQQIGQQKSPTAVVPMPAGVGSGGGTNSPQHQQSVGLDIDLEQVLRSEAARAPFHQFLQQQFCAENINFYLAVEEYRKIPEEELDRRLDFGRQIYDRHFAANCIEPVNIDNSTSNQIREAYKNNRFTATVYDVVQYQIFHLLKYDCWPRYLRAGGQLTEEFGGDSKSHDSGASQHQQPKTRSNNSSTTNRRKSLFLRLLRLQRSGAIDIDDEIEDDKNNKICHCSNPFVKQINGELQQQRRPLIPLNSCGTNILFSVDENKIERRISTRLPKKPVNSINNTKRARKSYGGTSTVSFWRDATKQRNNRCRACDGIIFGESKPDFPLRYCTLLCADSATSTEITLSDPFQSVRQWTVTMAEGCGLDKNACEVVDAQTGSTIDPVRQAVDALNNRVVRIMSVVKFPVVFLGPSACPSSGSSSKPSAPLPAKVVIIRCRPALTVGKVLRPIMSKYNVDTEQAIVCLAGTCDVLKLQTPVSNIYQKTLSVMTQQQFAERKLLPKRETQKELTITPQWMLSASGQSSPGSPDIPSPPFHQHGDISFCEVPLEPESGIKLGGGLLLKHSATRSYSSNPREFFKFGRKPTVQSKVARSGGTETDSTTANATTTATTTQSSDSPHQQPSTSTSAASHLRYRKSGGSTMGAGRNSASKEADRRKSFGAAASAASPIEGSSGIEPDEGSGHNKGPRLSGTALAVGLVAPSDIPYCGETETTEDESTRPLYEVCSPYSVQSSMAKHEPVPFTKSAAFTSSNSSNISPGANCQPNQHQQQHSPLPAIFASAIGSGDKDNNNAITTTNTGISPSHSTESGTMVWQKADYV